MGTPLGEFELIRRFFVRQTKGGDTKIRGAAESGVILGIGDDAAVLALPPNTELIAAVDTIVADRHFPQGTDARSIGHRALAVNLSDLAAMGATPAWATLALTLPSADAAWLTRFSAGLLDLADEHAVSLVGGDTTQGPLTVSVQVLGHVPRGTALRRDSAHDGDILAVTGTLGDAGAGLAISTGLWATAPSEAAAAFKQRFDYPTARVQFGLAARGIASAAMDLSDGLVGDLPKLAQASGLAAHVAVERLPLSDAMRVSVGANQAREWALAAGDDYELLLAVPPARFGDLEAAATRLNLRLTAVGALRAGLGVTWSLDGRDFQPASRGYDHFAQAST
ncbi:MAG: thiamine-phosphate kinase [Gammaproteobacteria bacterium]